MPSTIRKVAAPLPSSLPLNAAAAASGDRSAPPPPGRTAAAPVPRPVMAPLTPDRYRLQFTVSKETHDKLRRAQDLLCREIPDGDPGGDLRARARSAPARRREEEARRDQKAATPAERRRAHATSPLTFVAWYGSGTEGSAHSSGRAAGARSGGSWSGTTSSRSAIRGRRRSRTSPCGAAPTTCTRASRVRGSSSIAREPRETYAVSREFASFRNGSGRGALDEASGDGVPGPEHVICSRADRAREIEAPLWSIGSGAAASKSACVSRRR